MRSCNHVWRFEFIHYCIICFAVGEFDSETRTIREISEGIDADER